ncbi:hypothetical protein [Hyphomicrobium sp. DMF-1]|uniref:hypothetical protein n=1 Tax=Hyphomicrobium sp. DMF-1 TaxID=3019544 RepID=UPI0022EBFBDF|nr:hypothetical protein [Hyphomicrobium sp. DMF-1]WBT37694.1 hypothetical protein PE058_18840 [Hyphomicrobium sp. DMF-1]
MGKPPKGNVPIVIFGCNASDDAVTSDLPCEIDDSHEATISTETYEAIFAAKQAFQNNPHWDSTAITSDMKCKPLDDMLSAADMWRTGVETFHVYRFGGLYLRLLHKDNRQAEIEFEVVRPDGAALIPPLRTAR